MVLREALHRLQGRFEQLQGRIRGLVGKRRTHHHDNGGSSRTGTGSGANRARLSTTPRTTGRPSYNYKYRYRNATDANNQNVRTTTGLDIARFALISIATLPFSLWVALYSYHYAYRVQLCQEALAEEDKEISYLRRERYSSTSTSDSSEDNGTNSNNHSIIGRERQIAEVKSLLSQTPHQIVVVAGANESGKSRFVSEIVKSVSSLDRGITYLQLAQIVDSLSTLTHALVRAFDLRWLSMRHSLVDVLPFAGSEILVMKERFSDRDLAQALLVITEALKAKAASTINKHHHHNHNQQRPVIIIDGLGEGSAWIRSPEGRGSLQRLLKWCIYITKERRLAHVVLTGNEELVISLTGQNKITRGHVKVIGLNDLTLEQAALIVRQEIPDVSPEEIQKITHIFGGFIHDLQAVSREIQARLVGGQSNNNNTFHSRGKLFDNVISSRFRLQVERVTAAFAKGRSENEPAMESSEEDDEEEEMDPYLGPLKATYSEASAAENDNVDDESAMGSWSQLQLWQTLQRLVDNNMAVPFADLRDDVFGGDIDPLLELMNEDVLGFEVESTSAARGGWSWEVKPATPALGRVFHHLVNNSSLKERFQDVKHTQESLEQKQAIENERRRLRRERRFLDRRKESLLKTVELKKELRIWHDRATRQDLEKVYSSIVVQEVANEKKGLKIRNELEAIIKAKAEKEALEKDEQKKQAENQTKSASSSSSSSTSSSKQDDSSSSSKTAAPKDIQALLKSAILENYVQGESKDKFERFRDAFQTLNSDSATGISAEDVVRLTKATSGEEIDLKAARAFIQAWDLNNDSNLDYDEFVRMLLTDPKNRVKNKVTKKSSSSTTGKK